MEQRSESWFEARKAKVTASVAGAILGLDPNRTREDVMRDMVRSALGAEKEFVGNIATQWGVVHEDEAKADFELITGHEVRKAYFVVRHDMDWLGATPDGYVGNDAVLEIKCPFGIRNEDYPVFKKIKNQPHYFAQVQIQMFVTATQVCHFWQWTPYGSELETVEYDDVYMQSILPELKAFYDEFKQNVKEHSAEFLEEKRVVVDTPRAHQLVEEYHQLRDAISAAEERQKEVLNAMVTLAGNKNAVIAGKLLTKVQRAGSISYSAAVKALMPDADLEPWRGKPSSYWVVK